MSGSILSRALQSALPVAVLALPCVAQSPERDRPAPERVVVADGVMYWEESREEVALVGAHYSPAYYDTYVALGLLGKDRKEAIEEDTYHYARLGLDAYRVHMFFNQLIDEEGNLLENDHLDVHDYTVHQMAERDIKTILTPIVGFFAVSPLSDAALRRYKNYLTQLLTHVNPYTGRTAIEDPYIIGLEITNEPRHADYDRTLALVNDLAGHLRGLGWDKPIFYNITHNFDVTDAFLDAEIDGVTFQWYPAGLVGNRTIKKNYFPYIDDYPIPWADDERFQAKARMVYEHSPADVLHSYALPMMARSFREVGMQFATQFAYDPLAIAHANTNYETHYLNLAYTPGKAVGMRIAAEVFRRVPLRQRFDAYPADTVFGDFVLSHQRDLALLNAEDEFLHTNGTSAAPRNEHALQHLAGVGSSPVVSYPGTGAYFLDRLEDGVWRLEVMPDAIQVQDPFERPDLYRNVVHIDWRQHPMRITLADLGASFSIRGLNEGNRTATSASDGSFTVGPGAYLLTRAGVPSGDWTPESWTGRVRIGEYHAVPPSADSPAVWHTPFEVVEAGKPLTVAANVVGLSEGDTVYVQADPYGARSQLIAMEEVRPYRFEAVIPAEAVRPGRIEYWIFVDQGDDTFVSFPGGHPGHIPVVGWQRDYYHERRWTTRVVPSGHPIELWNAEADYRSTEAGLEGPDAESELVAVEAAGELIWRVSSGRPTAHRHVVGLAAYIGDRLSGITPATLDSYREVVVRAKADRPLPSDFKVVLVDRHGSAYSAAVPLTGTLESHRIPLSSLTPDRFMLLPRPYPTFLESWFASGVPGPVRTSAVEEIQFLIDTSDAGDLGGQRYGFEIESAWLQ
jgi:hypothetical protein